MQYELGYERSGGRAAVERGVPKHVPNSADLRPANRIELAENPRTHRESAAKGNSSSEGSRFDSQWGMQPGGTDRRPDDARLARGVVEALGVDDLVARRLQHALAPNARSSLMRARRGRPWGI